MRQFRGDDARGTKGPSAEGLGPDGRTGFGRRRQALGPRPTLSNAQVEQYRAMRWSARGIASLTASARRFQPGVGQDQPLGTDGFEIDLDASAGPRALAI